MSAKRQPVSDDEADRKIRQTIAWWNNHGELQQQIHYDAVAEPLTRVSSRQAMQILNNMGERKERITNPTGYIRAECQRLGGGADREADAKMRRTIGWINKQAGLKEELRYCDVAGPLSQLDAQQGGRVLHNVCEKATEIRDPTGYIMGAVRRIKGEEKPELDEKVKSTIRWWNTHGGLQQGLDYNSILVPLSQLDTRDALYILAGLEGKEGEVTNPTGWVCSAARKRLERISA
mmetsp:Transcript_4664/g.10303  ORF Transcript_4664/g.10303 Transcript_4664/m.10303 type:complete len:234 (+) Transcript_4664:48-749(+)